MMMTMMKVFVDDDGDDDDSDYRDDSRDDKISNNHNGNNCDGQTLHFKTQNRVVAGVNIIIWGL